MKNLLLPPVLVIFATLAATPVVAQQSGTVPGQLPHITNPSVSLSAPATGPLQQQMQDDYATQLRGVQQNLLQQNPSGLTRPELGVSRALTGFSPR
jgi:hypothetical protein